MKSRQKVMQTLVIGLALLLSSCITDAPLSGPHPWAYSTPEQQGFDSEVLLEFLEKIESDNLDVHSIMLMRKKHVFLEFYNYPYGPDSLHHTKSVGKSVLSALVGIALENGDLTSLDTPMLKSFPEHVETAADPRKAEITLRHALTMQAGLNAGDYDNDSFFSYVFASDSWIGPTWEQEMVQPAGHTFNYSSFVSHLISNVLERTIDGSLDDYARNILFDPIGIVDVQIEHDIEGNWFGAGPLWLTTQDMLRFGRLFLNDGQWNGEQIVPKQWVRESTRNQIGNQPAAPAGDNARYGYHWWVFDEAFAAMGVGGQLIMVIPGLDLVAVVTRADETVDIAEELLRALKSAFWKVKANPNAVAELHSQIEKMGKPTRNIVKKRSSLERAISGQRFKITSSDKPDRTSHYRSFTFYFEEDPTLSRLLFEFDNEQFVVPIGRSDAQLFTNTSRPGQRPDKAGPFASSARWTGNNTFEVDIHEVGYPVKERWRFTFNGNNLEMTASTRGADTSEMSLVAERNAKSHK